MRRKAHDALSVLIACVIFISTASLGYAVVKEQPIVSSQKDLSTEASSEKSKDDFPIEVNADNVEYIKEQEIVKGIGNVVINFKGVHLSADSITVNLVTKEADAIGNVRFLQGDRIYTADRVTYNFQTEQGHFIHTKGKFEPFYLYGGEVVKAAGRAEYHIQDGYVTTSDYRTPDYRIKAREVHIYTNDKIVMRDIVFEVGTLPVFWFPFWYYPLQDKESPVSIVPGYSHRWGMYLLSSAQIYNSQNMTVKLVGDYRSKRGPAGGVDVDYNFNNQVKGMITTYLMEDDEFEDFDEKFDGETKLETTEKTRYRLTWEHEQLISPSTRLLGQFNLQSDKQIIDDFFADEFQEQIQRVNFFDLTRATEAYQMEVYVAPKFNSFFDVLERLPEAKFMNRNMKVFDTPFYFKSDMEVADLNFKFDDKNLDFESFRGAWLNELSMPVYLWNAVNVIPYIGGGVMMYSDMRRGSDDVRGYVDGGIRSSTRVSKIYRVDKPNWNIHDIRHIFEPTMDFKMVRTNVDVDDVHQFDRIDAITHDTAVSFRFRNVFQTKRWREKVVVEQPKQGSKKAVYSKGIEEVSKDLIDFSLSFDIFPTKANRDSFAVGHINPVYENFSMLDFFFRRNITLGSPYVSSYENKYISELLFDMKFSPFDWLTTSLKGRYDPHDRQIEELSVGVTFYNADKVSWDVYTSFYLGGSTQLSHTFSYQINSDWRFRVGHILDFDRSTTPSILEYQRYTLIKDLHEWELAISYSDRRYFRQHAITDRSFFVMFYLKDFPNVQLKLGH